MHYNNKSITLIVFNLIFCLNKKNIFKLFNKQAGLEQGHTQNLLQSFKGDVQSSHLSERGFQLNI